MSKHETEFPDTEWLNRAGEAAASVCGGYMEFDGVDEETRLAIMNEAVWAAFGVVRAQVLAEAQERIEAVVEEAAAYEEKWAVGDPEVRRARHGRAALLRTVLAAALAALLAGKETCASPGRRNIPAENLRVVQAAIDDAHQSLNPDRGDDYLAGALDLMRLIRRRLAALSEEADQ